MSLPDAKNSRLSETQESALKVPSYPLLKQYVRSTLGHEPDETELINFFNRKYPDKIDYTLRDYVPRVEGMLYKIKNLDDPQQFIKNLGLHGLVGTSDGVKIALVNDKVSKEMSDAIIMGNMELLLQTAAKLNLDIHLGKYSGDEDIFILIPKNINANTNQANLKDVFAQTLSALSEEYYNHPFFAPAKAAIFQEYGETEQIGLHLHLATPNEVKIYHPMLYNKDGHELGRQDPSFKSAMGSIIDAAANNQILSDENSISFTQYLSSKIKEEQKDSKTLLEFEDMFPKDLQVRKLATLISRSKTRLAQQNSDDKLYMIRLADVRLKWENKMNGHTKGDHEMIAVANIIRRLQQELAITGEIDIYQDNGSLLMVTDKLSYEKISIVLEDPVFLNTYFKKIEQERELKSGQDEELRANPFIVATPKVKSKNGTYKPVTIAKDFTEEQIWGEITKLRERQLTNEVLVLIYTSGLTKSILDQSTLDLTSVSDSLLDSDILPGTIDSNYLDLIWLARLFEEYDKLRPYFYSEVISDLKTPIVEQFEDLVSKLRSPPLS